MPAAVRQRTRQHVDGVDPVAAHERTPDPLEPIKRRAYLLACALALPVELVGWFVLAGDPAVASGYAAVAIATVVIAVLTAGGLRMTWLEPLGYLLLTVGFLVRLVLVLYVAEDLVAQVGELVISLLVMTISYLLAFLFFEMAVAVVASVVVLGVAAALTVARVVAIGPSVTLPDSGMPLLKAFTIQAVTIALLYVLAGTKAHLADLRVRGAQLAVAARTDALTGVANRRELCRVIEAHLAAADGHPLTVVLLDIDHFKAVNDVHGHDVGDQVLRHVCRILEEEVRGADTLGRWGGEEFLIVSPEADLTAGEQLAERCRQRLRATPVPDLGVVTASFGVAELRPGDDLDALLRRADEALYRAKREGRDRVSAGR